MKTHLLLPLALAFILLACNADQPSPTASPAPPPQVTAASPEVTASPPPPSPAPTPAASPPPAGPRERAYALVRTLPAATFQAMLGLDSIPGSPSEAVLITQRGQLYRLSLDGASAPALFGDISDRLSGARGGEEGLLGLAFSPTFSSDGRLYLYYTRGSPQPSVLSRFRVVNDQLDEASEQVLLEIPQPFSNHNGGQLTFGPDGYLYLALGDGGSGGDPQGNGQNPGTLLGKILRLDVSGAGLSAPPDNPFVGRAGARPEVYAYGLRNPWRMSFDRASGQLWAADVGQNRWEEVDRIVAGGNYGWNRMEGFECFRGAPCDTAGLRMPRAVYGRDDGCSIIGGYVYRGPSMPELDGWYVYADFCSGRIWALNTADNSEPLLLLDTDLTISSFAELPSGELLVITFDRAIYSLRRGG